MSKKKQQSLTLQIWRTSFERVHMKTMFLFTERSFIFGSFSLDLCFLLFSEDQLLPSASFLMSSRSGGMQLVFIRCFCYKLQAPLLSCDLVTNALHGNKMSFNLPSVFVKLNQSRPAGALSGSWTVVQRDPHRSAVNLRLRVAEACWSPHW